MLSVPAQRPWKADYLLSGTKVANECLVAQRRDLEDLACIAFRLSTRRQFMCSGNEGNGNDFGQNLSHLRRGIASRLQSAWRGLHIERAMIDMISCFETAMGIPRIDGIAKRIEFHCYCGKISYVLPVNELCSSVDLKRM